MIYSIDSLRLVVKDLYQRGLDKGASTGHEELDKYYRVKKGSTTYITGIPGHGKTTWVEDVKMSLSERHGWKHLMYSPEIGSVEEVAAELVHMRMRKPFHSLGLDRISEKDVDEAMNWLARHYVLIDDEEGGYMTVDAILNYADEVKPDSITIDPWNELFHDFTQYGGREDIYLEFTLGKIRRFARSRKLHVFLIAHPRMPRQKEDGSYDPPTFYDMKGGSAWGAKGDMIVCTYRDNFENHENEIIIQKAKPKYVGRRGSVRMVYNKFEARFYCKEINHGVKNFYEKNNDEPPF